MVEQLNQKSILPKECFGNRKESNAECDACEYILRCSILTLKEIGCITKASIHICGMDEYGKEKE
jgi:hypothetical protein